MARTKIPILFLLITVAISCNNHGVVGTWKRMDTSKYHRSDSNQNGIGDLIISPDSTFLIKGIDTHDTSIVTGWHSGGTIKRTWAIPDKSHIILPPNDADKRFAPAFTFNIITLDNQNLVMSSAFEANDTNGIALIFTRQ